MPGKPWRWWEPLIIEDDPRVPVPAAYDHHRCGVPGCEDGYVVSRDVRETVVECDTHNARTTHDTVRRPPAPQQVIRVQDSWRQHGTTPPPGK